MPELKLDCPTAPNDTGAYRIAWTAPEGATVTLTEDGAKIYEGPDAATTVSGRREGTYEYALAVADAKASCTVQVAPPSMGLTFALFLVGFAISASTIAFVVRGHRQHRRGEIG